jgi:hypothetical protein
VDAKRLLELYAFSYREGFRGIRAVWPWRFLGLVIVYLAIVVVAVVLHAVWLAILGAGAVGLLLFLLIPRNIRAEQRARALAFREETRRREDTAHHTSGEDNGA